MRDLPEALLIETTKLETLGSWLVLFDIILPNEQGTLRIVKNSENIQFEGNIYVAFPVELDTTTDSSSGNIQSLTLKVSNITRIVQSYLEQLDGLVGGQVIIKIVKSDLLEENYAELERTYDIIGSSADAKYVNVILGAPNPLSKRFPLHRYLANYCNWRFKSAECGYSGEDLVCKRTLEACRNKNNSTRFGGHIGLTSGGVRVV